MPQQQRVFITDDFLRRIVVDGALAQATLRLNHGFEIAIQRLPQMSTWALICEEMVDTEHEPEYYERVVNELYFRGLTDSEIQQMRLFAWRTAGWLNFEMMLWDWAGLDENDILRAILWLRRRREISRTEARSMKEYVFQYFQPESNERKNDEFR